MWRVVMEGMGGYKEAQTDPRRAARACGGLEGSGLVDGTVDGGSARLAARRAKVMVVLSDAMRGMEIVRSWIVGLRGGEPRSTTCGTRSGLASGAKGDSPTPGTVDDGDARCAARLTKGDGEAEWREERHKIAKIVDNRSEGGEA